MHLIWMHIKTKINIAMYSAHVILCLSCLFYTSLYDLYDMTWFLSQKAKYDTHWAVSESPPLCQSFQITSIKCYVTGHQWATHDGVMKRKHFSCYWLLVRRSQQSPVDLLHKGPVMRGFGVWYFVSLNKLFKKQPICRWFETPYYSCEGTVNKTHFRKRIISEIIFEFAIPYWWKSFYCYLISGHRVATHCCIYND